MAVTAMLSPTATQPVVVVTVMLVKVWPWTLAAGKRKTKASIKLRTPRIPFFLMETPKEIN